MYPSKVRQWEITFEDIFEKSVLVWANSSLEAGAEFLLQWKLAHLGSDMKAPRMADISQLT